MSFLLWILSALKWAKTNWVLVAYVVGALAIAGLVLYVRHVIEENGKLETQVEQLQTDLKTERETRQKVVAALEERAKNAEDRNNFAGKSAKAIEEGRKTGDAPMAPVLRDTISRLRERQAQHAGNPG